MHCMQRYASDLNMTHDDAFNRIAVPILLHLWSNETVRMMANYVCTNNVLFWNIHVIRLIEKALFNSCKTEINNLVFFGRLKEVLHWHVQCAKDCGWCKYNAIRKQAKVCCVYCVVIYLYIFTYVQDQHKGTTPSAPASSTVYLTNAFPPDEVHSIKIHWRSFALVEQQMKKYLKLKQLMESQNENKSILKKLDIIAERNTEKWKYAKVFGKSFHGKDNNYYGKDSNNKSNYGKGNNNNDNDNDSNYGKGNNNNNDNDSNYGIF